MKANTSFILKLKHWQIFVAIWVFPNVFFFIDLIDTGYDKLGFKIALSLFGILTYVYYGLLTVNLYKLHSDKVSKGHFFLISLNILNLIFCVYMALSLGDNRFILYMGPFYLLSAFLCITYVTINYREVELKNKKSIENPYYVDFFLFYMLPFFIWITQPKLNKMMEEEEMNYGKAK